MLAHLSCSLFLIMLLSASLCIPLTLALLCGTLDFTKIYEETRNNILEGEALQKQQVAILRDGFVGFQDKYRVISS